MSILKDNFEMKFSGVFLKMHTIAENPVRYLLRHDDLSVEISQWIGEIVRLSYSGKIYCSHCGKTTKKSYAQGFCFPCSIKLAECDLCIMKPETCHYAQGTCREPTWGEEHCLRPHVVYLANSSGPKVGITRRTQVPFRWIDQGATAALPVLEVQDRKTSGLIEVIFKQYISDKTDWRKMLRGKAESIDLLHLKSQILSSAQEQLNNFKFKLLDEPVSTFEYPVIQYPDKVSSINLDKVPYINSKLMGIKGQYLIFETGVLNVRSHSGYSVTIEVENAT